MGKSLATNIIGPPKLGSYPPPVMTAASTLSPGSDDNSPDSFHLPRREIANHYISRFLEDVHCTHWFYPIETFLCRVERTYSGDEPDVSNSWMCSLYAIFAIGAANYKDPTGKKLMTRGSPAAEDENTSTDYINLAKQLIPNVYDEADLDSIRAMAIMVRHLIPIGFNGECG